MIIGVENSPKYSQSSPKFEFIPRKKFLILKGVVVRYVVSSFDSKLSSKIISNRCYHIEGESDLNYKMGDLKDYATPGQLLSPAAKIYLIRHKLKAINIKATGKKGMLLKQDIVQYLKDPAKYTNEGVSQTGSTLSTPKSSFKISPPSGEDQVVKLDTSMKKRKVQLMTQSKAIPSLVFTDEYDMTDLLEFEKTHYSKMTMILKSISIALSKFPSMNTIVNPDVDVDGYIHEYVFRKDHNISVAH